MKKFPGFDLDRRPWNDLSPKFLLTSEETLVIGIYMPDMMKKYQNNSIQWRKRCGFWVKIEEILGFDIDLWPWNDLSSKFLLASKETLAVGIYIPDMMKKYPYNSIQWRKRCGFWVKNEEFSGIWPWPLTLKWPSFWISIG